MSKVAAIRRALLTLYAEECCALLRRLDALMHGKQFVKHIFGSYKCNQAWTRLFRPKWKCNKNYSGFLPHPCVTSKEFSSVACSLFHFFTLCWRRLLSHSPELKMTKYLSNFRESLGMLFLGVVTSAFGKTQFFTSQTGC